VRLHYLNADLFPRCMVVKSPGKNKKSQIQALFGRHANYYVELQCFPATQTFHSIH